MAMEELTLFVKKKETGITMKVLRFKFISLVVMVILMSSLPIILIINDISNLMMVLISFLAIIMAMEELTLSDKKKETGITMKVLRFKFISLVVMVILMSSLPIILIINDISNLMMVLISFLAIIMAMEELTLYVKKRETGMMI